MQRIGLPSYIFDWDLLPESAQMLGDRARLRPLELVTHCDRIIASHQEDAYRADAILNLNRAVEIRLKQLEDTYRFGRLPYWGRDLGQLQLLESCGLLRSSMVLRLNKLRNLIEHQDMQPPATVECKDYIDFVWYFLKGTDRYVTYREDAITYERPPEWLRIEIDNANYWKMSASGCLLPSTIATKHPAVIVDATRLLTKREADREGPESTEDGGLRSFLEQIPDDALAVDGPIAGPADAFQRFVCDYFRI